jgi:hypothetical protein
MVLSEIRKLIEIIKATGLYNIVDWRPYQITNRNQYPLFLIEDIESRKEFQGGQLYTAEITLEALVCAESKTTDSKFSDLVSVTMNALHVELAKLDRVLKVKTDAVKQLDLNGVDSLIYFFDATIAVPEYMGELNGGF